MQALFDEFPVIVGAFWLTIRLTLAGGALALALGTVLAGMRVSPLPVLRGIGTAYVNILRNTPLTLVIVFCGLGLGLVLDVSFSTSLSTNYLWLSIIGLSAYTAAFVCEAIRAGINTVPLPTNSDGAPPSTRSRFPESCWASSCDSRCRNPCGARWTRSGLTTPRRSRRRSLSCERSVR